MADSSKLIATIERSERERLQIAINEYKGRSYLDVRIFYTTDNGETWRPTQKGITCAPEGLETLRDAVDEAMKEFTAIE
ncbi:MAG: transcriptional coactivator p15/PC4 family protein [Candidatus Gastranaerophilales bacterium]|nr:transcriptional coactivator p15/PC4 family protein [Candidatus Gastranaerophilales bacterium]